MKKVVLKLELHDDRYKQKAMQRVSGFPGVSSISMEMKDQKLTVIGDIDPVSVVAKLRKICHTEIVSVGEPDKKKEEPKKEEPKKDDLAEYWKAYQAYYHQPAPNYYVKTVEDPDPYGCVVM